MKTHNKGEEITKYTRAVNILEETLDGKKILLSLERELIYILNPSAAAIWEYTSKPRTIKQIVTLYKKKFALTEEQARREIVRFIKKYTNSLFFTHP